MSAVFVTKRLRVRDINPQDADNFFLLNGSEEVMRYIRPVKTKEESDEHFKQILSIPSTPENGRWAVEEKDTGKFIGTFAIIPIPSEPEKTQLGYSFIPEYWGRGLATELAQAGLKYFLDNTDIPEIYAVSETANIASMKVLQKTGFRFHNIKMEEGKELTVFIVKRIH